MVGNNFPYHFACKIVSCSHSGSGLKESHLGNSRLQAGLGFVGVQIGHDFSSRCKVD